MYLPNKNGTLRLLIVIALTLNLVSVVSAQVGSSTSHWNWTPSATHHDAIVKVETEDGSGTGVLIHIFETRPVANGFEGLCLTAHHVVSDDNGDRKIKVQYRNGKRAKRCKVLSSNEALDVALLWVWVPQDVEPATLSQTAAAVGMHLEFCGLGGGSDLNSIRHFSSESESPTNVNQVFASVPLLPGDSGGPVFNSNGEVLGIISGGWFWYDGGVKSQNGSTINITWPARACNLDPLAVLVQQALTNQSELAKN